MALVPQVNAWVLVGDSMLDLPIPELVPTQGVIFHEKATKQCRVLVVDPDGTHRWEELCAASPDNPIGQLYKFAGGIVTEDSLQHTLSMADDGELATTPSGDDQRQYVTVAKTTQVRFRGLVSANTSTTDSAFVILKNGVILVTITIPAGFNGQKPSDFPTAFADGDLLEVRLIKLAGGGPQEGIEATATVFLY